MHLVCSGILPRSGAERRVHNSETLPVVQLDGGGDPEQRAWSAGPRIHHIVQANKNAHHAGRSARRRACRPRQHVALALHALRIQAGAADECSAISSCAGCERWLTSLVWISSAARPRLFPHQGDRLSERPDRGWIRPVGEADMAVADLHEGKIRRLRLRYPGNAAWLPQ